MIEVLISSLNPETMLCIACDISLPTEMIKTQSIAQWKNAKLDIHKRPAMFIIQHKVITF
jgi:16S rRNA (cytidine1402-2'-O)-methyltransferase